MDVKEEIRSRLNIEDVVGGYVELRRAGRNFKALSPFSSEKTPSFVVSPEKQIWHDFSSNRGGDVFSFVMEMEGVDFRGALELLARKAGVDLSLYSNDRAKEFHQKKQRLYEVMELATKFYQYALGKSKGARTYWHEKRRFTPEIVERFRLGYSPKDGRSLHQFLLTRGFSAEELRSAGLLAQRSSGPGDMFRERMMVPLADGQGRVVGFTARLLADAKSAPKYINTPQTLLYDKGRQLYGLHLAKEAIRTQDYAVIVEGNLDVIASHQAGEAAVVASAGTALTKEHLGQLARLTPHIKLAFDGDKAGLAATERAIGIAQDIGISLSIINMPEGAKDPDELIQRDPALWQQAIADSVYALDWVIARHADASDLASAEGKRAFTTQVLAVVQKLQDAVEKEHYLGVIAAHIGGSRQAVRQKLQAVDQKTAAVPAVPVPRRPRTSSAPSKPDQRAYQDDFLALLALHPSARDAFRYLEPTDLEGTSRQQLAAYLQGQPDDRLRGDLPPSLQPLSVYVKIVLLKAEERYGQRSEDECLQMALDLAQRIKKEHQKITKQELEHQLAIAEQRGESDTATGLKRQLAALIKEQGNAQKTSNP